MSSLLELFRIDAQTQTHVLTEGLLALERNPRAADQLEQCMRAAHSLKGAAHIVGVKAAVNVAHIMEDCFVAAQRGQRVLHRVLIDLLLRGVDWLTRIADTPEAELSQWSTNSAELETYLSALREAIANPDVADVEPAPVVSAPQTASGAQTAREERVLRVAAENLNRLLGLAGESLVGSRWLKPFTDSLLNLKRLQYESATALETFSLALPVHDQALKTSLSHVQQRIGASQELLGRQLAELEVYSRRANDQSQRLYDEALQSRMRPFADGVGAFPRMVRDVSHTLGKQARLEISGHTTPIDREMLEKLDAPLTHLLRNAVDHGVETAAERRAAGKPEQALIQLEASHSAGMLLISVTDDGRGVALERLKQRIVERELTNAETADKMSEAELLEFLFLPGFTLKDSVNEISGRGVGLDVVQHMIKQVRGTIRVHTQPGHGTRFQLQLPLTLSVVRALLVDIGGEPYAFPLAHVARTLKLAAGDISQLEGRQHFSFGGRQVGLVSAHQILQKAEAPLGDSLPVVVIGEAASCYGVIVDRLLGERELVVQPLDTRLGKIKDISAAALMEDGSPTLIVDVDDLIRSVEKLATEGTLARTRGGARGTQVKQRKRVLVVDDSFTVRELERKLLEGRGYEVEIAVDGMDGWNAARLGHFDLIVTDVDMPRLDGIELVHLIKRDPKLKTLPVMIVSYKDREEDRQRGLDAGADYYLTKGSFHDESLLEAVLDLIGEAQS